MVTKAIAAPMSESHAARKESAQAQKELPTLITREEVCAPFLPPLARPWVTP